MSFWDDLTGSSAADAAQQAAAQTYALQQAAAAKTRQAGKTYAGQIEGVAQGYNPYTSAGTSALDRLLAGYGLGPNAGDFASGYQSLPGYKEGLETGTNAVLRGVNASGMSNSGRALKALYRFGSDYENQRAGDYLTRLAALAGQGLSATGARSGLLQQGYGGQLGASTTAGGQEYQTAAVPGQGLVAGEQARQQGAQNLLGTAAYLAGSFIPKIPGTGGGLPTGGSTMPRFGPYPFG